MLSDKVEVNTVYYNEQKMNRISFERNSEYICLTYEDTVRQQGTEIILDYDQCLSVFNNNIERLVSFIENNFWIVEYRLKYQQWKKVYQCHWNVILRGLKQ